MSAALGRHRRTSAFSVLETFDALLADMLHICRTQRAANPPSSDARSAAPLDGEPLGERRGGVKVRSAVCLEAAPPKNAVVDEPHLLENLRAPACARGPIRRRKRVYIPTTDQSRPSHTSLNTAAHPPAHGDQSDAESVGRFPQRTNQDPATPP
eukprot:1195887-Prorocentrum_minimum.AAC.2